MRICSDFLNKQCFIGFDMHMLIVIFLLFQVRFNSITKKSLKIVQHVDVAIKSYVIYILTGSTFDGFIDCTDIKQKEWAPECEGPHLWPHLNSCYVILILPI